MALLAWIVTLGVNRILLPRKIYDNAKAAWKKQLQAVMLRNLIRNNREGN